MVLFIGLIVTLGLIFWYCIYLDNKNDKYLDRKREEEVALLKLRLETELLVPRSKIRIETFDDIFYTNYFTAELKYACSFYNDRLHTSKNIAQQSIQQSFKQEYFVTHDGIHIPIRLIKCAQIV